MNWYWPSLFTPHLDWLQVEISTHCNAACLYCPRTLYASCWHNYLMPLDIFRQLTPVLQKTRLVYLQGWGEPFTHPAFFEFASLAKAAGCQVGTTTNGMLLSEELCWRLVEGQIDIVAFSLAGIDETNDQIRQGTSLKRVLACIDTLNRFKERRGVDKPAIHIAYLLLRSRLGDVEALPSFLKPLGINHVVISTLDLIADQRLADEAIAPVDEEEYEALRRRLDATIAAGHDLGLPMHAWLTAPKSRHREVDYADGEAKLSISLTRGVCTEHIFNAAFVAADGGVSPCVYANLPLTAQVTHLVDGKETILTPLKFGSIDQQSFAAIWRSPGYRAFRMAHQTGQTLTPCRECVRMRMLFNQQVKEGSFV